MNLRDLKYLIAVADYGHFGKAAEYCCVSQPALSMQLKKLEETFGVILIERTNKASLLTKVGKEIVAKARELLGQIEEMKSIAQQARDPFSGQLILGIIPTFAPYVLPHIIFGLTQKFPRVKFLLVEEQTARLLNKLRHGELDAAILALPIQDSDFQTTPLFEEEFMLAVPLKHKLADRKMIKESDLNNKVLYLLEEGHCLREQTLSFCKKAMASEENHFKATSLETLRHMVAANVGITLMPKLACRSDDGVCYLPFTSPKPTRQSGLVQRISCTKNVLVEAVAKEIKKLLKGKEIRVL